ncbi:MAG: glycosyl hydrolase [Flavobacteriales bacterium]|nr:glycosyl hydrolase [Flavobacteriales bacterium]
MKTVLLSFTLITLFCSISTAQKGKKSTTEAKTTYKSSTFSGLKFRNVGPSFTSGRIADIAINPNNPYEYYVAVASGGVWKTTNSGTTYSPIFDSQGSYSIGCVTIAPSNSNVVWIGSGENNNQRSVAYGDGVYKSEDGGKSFKNMGLKSSEHIGKIVIHPTNQNIVYVAAYGPLWSKGGERGVYKTTDGGETWNRILEISENTGINEILMDPRDPNVLYATAHQRRRHVWTYIDGGPETGIHKSIDVGKTWKKLTSGLPTGDVGRIGMAISPANPDFVYAIIKASDKKGGFFRSTDRGVSWSKMSDYQSSGNYYQEIVCDPYEVDKVFSMNTWLHHTEDGGKNFKKTGEKSKHVDNHCMWIDPLNTEHWIVGCDGGLYETWDHAKNWQFKANLPLTQFYKVAVDNASPFYNIYGGTQDNNSMGGPSRTLNNAGIANSDWYITNGGDGFESQIDPTDPNIVYAQAQYGWLVRFDKKSGEKIGIQPMPAKGEAPFRWNWDAPLLISPHHHKRLYFCANKVFRSEDQGNTWKAISGDLSRQLDRNKLKVMDRVWGMDAVMKNKSTSIFGNIVAFDESPKKEDLLYVGTDDGLIHISENAGTSWKKIDQVAGVPTQTYVNMLLASQHDETVVFAAFNNHKQGDFKPYLFKSSDKGANWTSISGNLPDRGSVYSIAEDHENKDLLFAGTEFGVFFSVNGGKEWTKLSAGIPTIAARDMAIQKRENDLVIGSFGRGFYVLDDYSPLREITPELLKEQSHIFKIKDGLMYIPTNPLGLRGKSAQGESYYTAPNPTYGVTFTYYIKDKLLSLKETRQASEKKIKKDGGDVYFPSAQNIKAEDQEEKPYLLFVIKDAQGNVIRKMKTGPKSGINRISWDFRLASTSPIKLSKGSVGRYSSADKGPMALPGNYTVEIHQSKNGVISILNGPTNFTIKPLNNQTLIASDKAALLQFQNDLAELRRSVSGTSRLIAETNKRIKHIKAAIQQYPSVPLELMGDVKTLESKMNEISISMWGDGSLSRRDVETYPGISSRIGTIVYQLWHTTTAPTNTQKDGYEIAKDEFAPVLSNLKSVIKNITELETKLNSFNAPYTPGRDDKWKDD